MLMGATMVRRAAEMVGDAEGVRAAADEQELLSRRYSTGSRALPLAGWPIPGMRAEFLDALGADEVALLRRIEPLAHSVER